VISNVTNKIDVTSDVTRNVILSLLVVCCHANIFFSQLEKRGEL